MTPAQVKAQIHALLDDVSAGEAIEITKHGRVVARLVPARGRHSLEGRLAGVAASAADDGGVAKAVRPPLAFPADQTDGLVATMTET